MGESAAEQGVERVDPGRKEAWSRGHLGSFPCTPALDPGTEINEQGLDLWLRASPWLVREPVFVLAFVRVDGPVSGSRALERAAFPGIDL
jgi:hypothetical protein